MGALKQISIAFPFQSYLDSTAHEAAILSQPTGEMIIPSTKKTAQLREGIERVGNAGYSQTPVAIRAVGGKTESGVVILKPGQSISIDGAASIEVGLPNGWLGGGLATILLTSKIDAQFPLDLGSSSRPEVIFHRLRTVIEALAAGPSLPTLKRNWPLQFPWTHSSLYTANGNADQGGNPSIRVEPTRALLRLRKQIAADTTVGVFFRGSREFDESSTGVVAATDLASTYTEITFKAPSDARNPYPMASLPDDFLRLACDEGGVTFTDLGDATLTNTEIDIVRFGRI